MSKAKTGALNSISITKAKASSLAMKLIDKLEVSIKTLKQSMEQFEQELQAAAKAALEHAEAHGDVMPMDRLVKLLNDSQHPMFKRAALEIVAWVRNVSPIRWDSKGNPRQLKEGDDGYKPYDVPAAEETPFYDTPTAKRAREAMANAHERSLKPVTLQDVINRSKGILKFIQGANEKDRNGEVRGIAKGEGTKVKKFAADLQAFLMDHGAIGDEDTKVQEGNKKAA